MAKLEPNDCVPKCPMCGVKLEEIGHWSEWIGVYFTWKCPNGCKTED